MIDTRKFGYQYYRYVTEKIYKLPDKGKPFGKSENKKGLEKC